MGVVPRELGFEISVGSFGWDCHDCGMSVQSCPTLVQLMNICDTHVCCDEEEDNE